MNIKKIEWVDGKYNTAYGKIGKLAVADISWTTGDLPYRCTCNAFGKLYDKKFGTREEAKFFAARAVEYFIRLLTEK